MDRPDLAALLAIEALNVADTDDAGNALVMALQSHPRLVTVINRKDWVLSVAFGPDGTLALAGRMGRCSSGGSGSSA